MINVVCDQILPLVCMVPPEDVMDLRESRLPCSVGAAGCVI